MGLDNFTEESSQNSTSNKNVTKQNNGGDNSKAEPYKVIHGDGNKKKVFKDKQSWLDALEVIKSQLGVSESELMSMSPGDRHETLHKGILISNGANGTSFRPKKKCAVCGNKFTFPKKWRFVRIKGEAICPHHDIGETMECVSSINSKSGV
jgi:hypothetical protein